MTAPVTKSPSRLSRRQLVELVTRIQRVLFTQSDESRVIWWDPDTEWDVETIECVSAILNDYGLLPKKRGRLR